MKLFDEHGTQMADIPKPEPVEHDGIWWEAVEYRVPKEGELYKRTQCEPRIHDFGFDPYWIMRPIPRATPEQLKAIGRRERDDRPMPVKQYEIVWLSNDGWFGSAISGSYRWVLVPVAKEEVHRWFCAACALYVDESEPSCPKCGRPKSPALKGDPRLTVGEIEKPEPVEQDGVWWEATKYRLTLKEEMALDDNCGGVYRSEGCRKNPTWVMRPIPRATPEQLKAIGMRERDERPMECKENDQVFVADGCYTSATHADCVGKHRWVLVPVAKEEVHTSCNGCYWEWNGHGSEERHHTCFTCHSPDNGSRKERKNYTPAPSPAPKVEDAAPKPVLMETPEEYRKHWLEIYLSCASLGMNTILTNTNTENVIAFIRSLAQRAGEPIRLRDPLSASRP